MSERCASKSNLIFDSVPSIQTFLFIIMPISTVIMLWWWGNGFPQLYRSSFTIGHLPLHSNIWYLFGFKLRYHTFVFSGSSHFKLSERKSKQYLCIILTTKYHQIIHSNWGVRSITNVMCYQMLTKRCRARILTKTYFMLWFTSYDTKCYKSKLFELSK